MTFRTAFSTALSGFRLLFPYATWSLAHHAQAVARRSQPRSFGRCVSVLTRGKPEGGPRNVSWTPSRKTALSESARTREVSPLWLVPASPGPQPVQLLRGFPLGRCRARSAGVRRPLHVGPLRVARKGDTAARVPLCHDCGLPCQPGGREVLEHSISVVLCAYTEERWEALSAAVDSVRRQTVRPREIIVVIDHNARLLARVRASMPDVNSVESAQQPGAGGARNTGVAAASGAIIAFLDDDAEARPDWLQQLAACYRDPHVLGVGGAIDPRWLAHIPAWFPPEFRWVIGCTYTGMPLKRARIRNLIAANMSVHRDVFQALGGFRPGFGNVKIPEKRPVLQLQSRAGDEEVEFCIRGLQTWPDAWWLYEPLAAVYHRVPPRRARFVYFLSRCYAEGLGAAALVRTLGIRDGLSTERTYVLKTLPLGVACGLRDVARGDLTGLGRSGAIIAGLSLTSAGYVLGSAFQRMPGVRGQRATSG
jgi:hypothetical protein